MLGTAGEVGTRLLSIFSLELPHMDERMLADEQWLTYISSEPTQDALYKICQERWRIAMDGNSISGKPVRL